MIKKKLYFGPHFGLGVFSAGYEIFTEDGKVLYIVSPCHIPKSSKEILGVAPHKKCVPKKRCERIFRKVRCTS